MAAPCAATGMSFYNGIKCIVYHYDPRFLALQGTLQALTMVMINVVSWPQTHKLQACLSGFIWFPPTILHSVGM